MSLHTLEELDQALQTAARESAETNRLINGEVMPRLDKLEKASRTAGFLNGHADDFKRMVEEYRGSYRQREAWAVVGSDLKRWFRFVNPFTSKAGAVLWLLASAVVFAYVSRLIH